MIFIVLLLLLESRLNLQIDLLLESVLGDGTRLNLLSESVDLGFDSVVFGLNFYFVLFTDLQILCQFDSLHDKLITFFFLLTQVSSGILIGGLGILNLLHELFDVRVLVSVEFCDKSLLVSLILGLDLSSLVLISFTKLFDFSFMRFLGISENLNGIV